MAGAWQGLDGVVAQAVQAQAVTVLGTYRNDNRRVVQDANVERGSAEGAYAKRQLFELLQNASDAIRGTSSGRCEVILGPDTLYVANSGEPVTVEGVIALMGTHDSVKRDDKIGRFGLGFKSLLAVTDGPRVFSRSGSFAFDRVKAKQVIQEVVPGHPHYPVLRWAEAIDPAQASRDDPILTGLMKWATTVVVAPLLRPQRVRDDLAADLRRFPAEFLLFSPHVEQLGLEDRVSGSARAITLASDAAGTVVLNDANRRSVWVVRRQVTRPSKAALEDGGYAAARESVEIAWAAPLEGTPKGWGRSGRTSRPRPGPRCPGSSTRPGSWPTIVSRCSPGGSTTSSSPRRCPPSSGTPSPPSTATANRPPCWMSSPPAGESGATTPTTSLTNP